MSTEAEVIQAVLVANGYHALQQGSDCGDCLPGQKYYVMDDDGVEHEVTEVTKESFNHLALAQHLQVMPADFYHLAPCAVEDGEVHFLPMQEKGPNFQKFCCGLMKPTELPTSPPPHSDIIRKYTAGEQFYCSKLNMALACDEPQWLRSHGMYIRHLKHVIGKFGNFEGGMLYRGVDLSPKEMKAMIRMQEFYFPSFTSTSKSRQKSFAGLTTHIFVIDATNPKPWAIDVAKIPGASPYDEDEVLLNCYTCFRITKVVILLDQRREIHLKVVMGVSDESKKFATAYGYKPRWENHLTMQVGFDQKWKGNEGKFAPAGYPVQDLNLKVMGGK